LNASQKANSISASRKLHQEEIGQQINRLDANKTGMIDFKVYIRDAFDNLYDAEILEEASLAVAASSSSTKSKAVNDDDEFKELKDLYKSERDKWNFISLEVTDKLTYDQFYMFVYSEEFADVQDYEAHVNFNKFDADRDGLISVDEFLANVQRKI
jgi:Ca2+-binding EF-hand superfamily protein